MIEINLKEMPIAGGWKKESVLLENGEHVTLLSSKYTAEKLRISHNAIGLYSLHLGLYRSSGQFCELIFKLGKNGNKRHIRSTYLIDDIQGGIQNTIITPIDCNAQDLVIQPVNRQASMCGIAWIKLEPITELPSWKKHNLGAVCDTHGMFARNGLKTSQDIEAILAPFVESDFDRICWGIGAGSFRMLYFSKVLPHFGEGKDSFYNEANTIVANTMKEFEKNNVDPLDVAIEYCHKNKIQLWANDRICHCYDLGKYNDDFSAPFYLENQHLRTTHGGGSKSPTLSLAYKEFQNLKIALYRELAEKGVDGIYIDLLRFPWIIGSDEPIIEEFEKQVGYRPTEKDFSSETWLKIRAGFVTEFMRKVRTMLNDVGHKQGRNIQLAIQGFSERSTSESGMIDENYMQGYDIKTWATEGLIDIFAPSTSRNHQPISLLYYDNLLKDTNCELWGCLGQHHQSLFATDYNHGIYFKNNPDKKITPIADLDPLRVVRNAVDYYNQQAKGLFLWEAGDVPTCPFRWNYLRTLGHKEKWMNTFTPQIGYFDGRQHLEQIKEKSLKI